MDTFVVSSFGTFVMGLLHGLFPAPSWQSCTLLACGWALATARHTLTTYLWRTRATTVKHFSQFSVFLGCPLYPQRWHLWGRSSARRPKLSQRARACRSPLTIRPRKKLAGISRGSRVTATVLAQPGKHTGRCGPALCFGYPAPSALVQCDRNASVSEIGGQTAFRRCSSHRPHRP